MSDKYSVVVQIEHEFEDGELVCSEMIDCFVIVTEDLDKARKIFGDLARATKPGTYE